MWSPPNSRAAKFGLLQTAHFRPCPNSSATLPISFERERATVKVEPGLAEFPSRIPGRARGRAAALMLKAVVRHARVGAHGQFEVQERQGGFQGASCHIGVDAGHRRRSRRAGGGCVHDLLRRGRLRRRSRAVPGLGYRPCADRNGLRGDGGGHNRVDTGHGCTSRGSATPSRRVRHPVSPGRGNGSGRCAWIRGTVRHLPRLSHVQHGPDRPDLDPRRLAAPQLRGALPALSCHWRGDRLDRLSSDHQFHIACPGTAGGHLQPSCRPLGWQPFRIGPLGHWRGGPLRRRKAAARQIDPADRYHRGVRRLPRVSPRDRYDSG